MTLLYFLFKKNRIVDIYATDSVKYTGLMIVFVIATIISFVLWYRFPEFEDSLFIRSELLGITLSYALLICVFFIIVIVQAITQMNMEFFIYYLQVAAYMTTFYLCVGKNIFIYMYIQDCHCLLRVLINYTTFVATYKKKLKLVYIYIYYTQSQWFEMTILYVYMCI